MDQFSKKKSAPQGLPAAERRRIGMVVHDDRGNASVSWHDAPSDYERPVLEVLGNPGLSIKHEETFDPYARRTARKPGGGPNTVTTRTDLRRLSEWIKMMRELEARKREDGGED
ncbi:MAG TPA: hypothetical protein VET66_04885 [Steroidobacteraceae bacterium]|nr:hypothetical protein [Steroidobacteraceae bacterium]